MKDFEQEHGRNGLMITAAVRYCLGRRTYIVGDCVEWIMANWKDWPDNVRTIIERDIEEQFTWDEHSPELKVLGDDCDKKSWEKVRELWRKE